MATKLIELKCLGCGADVTTEKKECDYCGKEIIISTFKDIDTMSLPQVNKCALIYQKALAQAPEHQKLNNAVAMCFLKLKLYDKALSAFEKAMEDNFDNADTFFYAAICLLKGKKAFLNPRTIIDKAEEYIDAALMIEDKGIFYYLKAYIRYDHHFRKGYNINPNYKQLLTNAMCAKVTGKEITDLYKVLGVDRPECI